MTARHVDEIECVLSVLMAIVLAHLLGASNVSWAAFSGYMVMRGHVLDSFSRGVRRILGTAVGAAAATLFGSALQGPLPVAVASAVVVWFSLYGTLTSRHGYAWLFFGLTFEMILLDHLEHPAHDVSTFAATRFLEVAAGTIACVCVSAASAVTLRRRWPGRRANPPTSLGWNLGAFRHAAQGAIAVALLPALNTAVKIPELAQAAVSIMAAMIIAVPSLGASGLVPVTKRLVQRFAGCVGGALLGGTVLFLVPHSAVSMLTGTVAGVAIGRHIENGRHSVTYSGAQFTLAVLVILVPDSYAAADLGPGLDRLIGILSGIAILEPVLLVWHLCAFLASARRA